MHKTRGCYCKFKGLFIIGQVINTYIPGYGRQNVYVKGIDRHGMVELVIIRPRPRDYIYVHQSDLVGIYPPTI